MIANGTEGRTRHARSCYLCADVARELESSGIAIKYGADALQRSFLYESESLFVIPAPGTLVVGYLIIAPRWHVRSFARLGHEGLRAAEQLTRSVVNFASSSGLDSYIFFEHGSSSHLKVGAACVDHAHLHACPVTQPRQVRAALAAFGLGEGEHLGCLPDLSHASTDHPYLLVGDGSDWFYYAVSDHLPSQLIRRIIARQIGEPDHWNWRVCPLPERFERTRQIFQRCEWTG